MTAHVGWNTNIEYLCNILYVQDAETKHMEEIEKAEKDKLDISEKLDLMMKQEATLTAKVFADFTHTNIHCEQKIQEFGVAFDVS